ncbi:MAG TPA: metallopeptidase family protein [Acidimicrobiia bacterium]|nr:metallopeptidase family protein [Acidimicrobiia bacterium]
MLVDIGRRLRCLHTRIGDVNNSEFDAAVDRAIESLPEWVTDRMDNIHVVVEDRPTREQGDVLGIYEGVSLLERSADYWGALPDRIIVFRKPHFDLELSDAELEEEIRRTVLHEIAHHLGIDDERLHELGWD